MTLDQIENIAAKYKTYIAQKLLEAVEKKRAK